MSDDAPNYPGCCFVLSPTFNVWCFLFARDLYALEYKPDLYGKQYHFHKNLPINWVRVVGIVVAIDTYTSGKNARIVYTLDDSSGATVQCVYRLPKVSPQQPLTGPDGVHVRVGMCVDVKGSLKTFRDVQVDIVKLRPICSTDEEIKLWTKRAVSRSSIFQAKPWILSEEQVHLCQQEAQEAARLAREEAKARKAKDDEAGFSLRASKKLKKKDKARQDNKDATTVEAIPQVLTAHLEPEDTKSDSNTENDVGDAFMLRKKRHSKPTIVHRQNLSPESLGAKEQEESFAIKRNPNQQETLIEDKVDDVKDDSDYRPDPFKLRGRPSKNNSQCRGITTTTTIKQSPPSAPSLATANSDEKKDISTFQLKKRGRFIHHR